MTGSNSGAISGNKVMRSPALHQLTIAAALLSALSPLPAFAWGQTAHGYVGELGAKNFPGTIPAFLRTPEAVWRIDMLSREPDRSRNAGQPHDYDLDPGHQIDGMDDGTVLGGPRLDALPASRRDFDTALRAVGSNEYAAGYLPYNIIDGWEQLVKDFSLWRADVAGMKFGATEADRQWYAKDRALRELIILRDLGYWSHFVGDASQPLHVTVHYNGWGDYPNPRGFETATGLHSKFETGFVNTNIKEADVAPLMPPYRDCACTIQQQTQNYPGRTPPPGWCRSISWKRTAPSISRRRNPRRLSPNASPMVPRCCATWWWRPGAPAMTR